MITIRKQSRGRSLLSKLLTFLFLGLLTGCAGKPPARSALQALQGKWHGVVVGDKSEDRYTVTIAGDSFHFQRDTNFWFETKIKLPSGTVPQQLHATIRHCAPGQENSLGKTVVALFKVVDDKLTIAARGDGSDELPKSFEATEDKGLTVYELSKVQASIPPIPHSSPTP